jgi:hypothetical protein
MDAVMRIVGGRLAVPAQCGERERIRDSGSP